MSTVNLRNLRREGKVFVDFFLFFFDGSNNTILTLLWREMVSGVVMCC